MRTVPLVLLAAFLIGCTFIRGDNNTVDKSRDIHGTNRVFEVTLPLLQ